MSISLFTEFSAEQKEKIESYRLKNSKKLNSQKNDFELSFDGKLLIGIAGLLIAVSIVLVYGLEFFATTNVINRSKEILGYSEQMRLTSIEIDSLSNVFDPWAKFFFIFGLVILFVGLLVSCGFLRKNKKSFVNEEKSIILKKPVNNKKWITIVGAILLGISVFGLIAIIYSPSVPFTDDYRCDVCNVLQPHIYSLHNISESIANEFCLFHSVGYAMMHLPLLTQTSPPIEIIAAVGLVLVNCILFGWMMVRKIQTNYFQNRRNQIINKTDASNSINN